MEEFRRGLLLTLLLSIAVIVYFFGPLLKDPNQVYFSPSGDGLKTYTGAIYHLQHDTTLFRMNAMNYPYGEMAFFTDCQPMIVNPVKMLANVGIDFRSQIVGIINLFMLVSIVLAAIFIFLIFLELKVAWWFAALASVGITMLSPQIGRLGGHFSLAHLLWLPLLIWLLMRFDKNKSFILSGIIGLVTFFAAGMHMYFFALFGFLFFFYWGYSLFTKQFALRDYRWVLHVFIQLVLPLILVQFIVGSNDTITDRTTHPWGFFNYRATPASVFLPVGKQYAAFLSSIKLFRNMEWESFAFIGLVALIGFVAGLITLFRRIARKQTWWNVSDHPIINVLFLSSVASLLLSFSIPFNLGLHFLLDYLGPIQQLRALSRFSWLFFYLINILVFYSLYQWMGKRALNKVLAGLALIFLFYDGYLNVKVYAAIMNNRVSELEDRTNSTPENEWVSLIQKDDYQAVLPLPYFHVGSENVWLEPKCEILRQSFIVSLKSGLPSMGVMLSRTSLSQTYKSLALVCTPVESFRILKDLPNQKPLLVMVDNCNELTFAERNLVAHSSLVWLGPKFTLYRLPISELDSIAVEGQNRFKREMDAVYASAPDSSSVFYFNDFEANEVSGSFQGKGSFTGEINNWNRILEQNLKGGMPGDTCEITFWVKGYETDLLPRTVFEFVQKDDDNTVDYKYDQFQHFYCSFKGDWMRIRIPFVMKTGTDFVTVAIRNTDLKHFQLQVDDVLVRKQR